MAVTGDLMVVVIGRRRVRGMGSITPNATSGLYALFHGVLSKYLGSFASWMREKLEDIPPFFLEVYIAVILLIAR